MELTSELQEKKIFLIEGLKKTYKDQYDAIQPLPYVKDRLYCVDKVFVEGGVEVCLAPELMRGTGGSWERLESYKSIYTDFRLKSKRRIIQGEPGYGKSTLTLQLAYDWCNDVSHSPMNNVEILILLRLRQLGSVKSLFRAIKMFLLSREPRVSIHDIEKIIRSCSSVHIILDGYDEYPGRDSNDNDDVHRILKMELFADFDVSLTTRYLPESLRKETKRAKLTGFDDKARDEYIRKAVVGKNDEAMEEIKQRLYENSILADLCQVPLIFVMFAHMAHDQRDFMNFKSVTQFFKHIIRCFYNHLKQKRKLYDNRSNEFYLHEKKHHQLDKIAFEGLNKKQQQLSWIKTEFRQRVGPELYDQYILIGILVEEAIESDFSTGDNVLFTTEVRFYHKLFCEWYAAHHLVTLVNKARNLKDKLRLLDPFDVQYLFRFACGLDPNAGKKLINHLKRLPGGDTFAILCILEKTLDVNDIMDSVKDICSRDVKIQEGDSALLQRSTKQLLEIASNNDLPVSCLHIEYSSIKFEGDTITLHSGIPLPILPTVEKINIAGSIIENDNTGSLARSLRYRQHGNEQYGIKRTLKKMDVLNLFHYGMKCGRVKELMFDQLQLPTFFSPEAFTETMRTRNIQVRWRPFNIEFHLDQQNGHWEVDDIQVIINENSGTVSLSERNNILQNTSTLQVLEVARNHDIPVSCLHLEFSSIEFEGDAVIPSSGIPLPILPTVEKIHIDASYAQYANTGTLTDNDLLNLFQYGMKCGRVKELMFDQFQLPTPSSSEAFTYIMTTKKIQVRWRPFDIEFHLDQQNGHWEVDNNNTDTLRQLCSDTVHIKKSDGIFKRDDIFKQKHTIMFINIASSHEIPISCLYLKESFSKIDDGDIRLNSGLRLSCPVSVEKVVIDTEKGREMTETEVVDILVFVQQSHMLQELEFTGCVLPLSFSSESLPIDMNSRDIKVCWSLLGREFLLNVQSGQWEVKDKESLRQLCSEKIVIGDRDQYLQQCLTIISVQIASYHDIPISCLYMEDSFSKIDAGGVILHSGLRLSCPVSVKKVVIHTEEGREMTETEVVDILMFVQQSHLLEELEFDGCLLPLIFSSESIPAELKSRDIKVFWNDYGYNLNLQSGVWEVDNVNTVRNLCTGMLELCRDDSELLQRCTIKLMENASYHDIPISCLYLYKSFSKIYASDVILHSGLRLSCPALVQKVVIHTEKGREMKETEVVDILMFVQQSHLLEELEFFNCLLPQSIIAMSILSKLKSKKVKVTWYIVCEEYKLILQSGRWMDRGTRQEITDTKYNDKVTWFRDRYRDT